MCAAWGMCDCWSGELGLILGCSSGTSFVTSFGVVSVLVTNPPCFPAHSDGPMTTCVEFMRRAGRIMVAPAGQKRRLVSGMLRKHELRRCGERLGEPCGQQIPKNQDAPCFHGVGCGVLILHANSSRRLSSPGDHERTRLPIRACTVPCRRRTGVHQASAAWLGRLCALEPEREPPCTVCLARRCSCQDDTVLRLLLESP